MYKVFRYLGQFVHRSCWSPMIDACGNFVIYVLCMHRWSYSVSDITASATTNTLPWTVTSLPNTNLHMPIHKHIPHKTFPYHDITLVRSTSHPVGSQSFIKTKYTTNFFILSKNKFIHDNTLLLVRKTSCYFT